MRSRASTLTRGWAYLHDHLKDKGIASTFQVLDPTPEAVAKWQALNANITKPKKVWVWDHLERDRLWGVRLPELKEIPLSSQKDYFRIWALSRYIVHNAEQILSKTTPKL